MNYYDRQGKPIDQDTYLVLFKDMSYRVIAKNEWISTVWLGLDHGYKNDSPQIFESIVWQNDLIYRYTNEADAEQGHIDLTLQWMPVKRHVLCLGGWFRVDLVDTSRLYDEVAG